MRNALAGTVQIIVCLALVMQNKYEQTATQGVHHALKYNRQTNNQPNKQRTHFNICFNLFSGSMQGTRWDTLAKRTRGR